MQDGELFDVTVSDALRLLTAGQKTNSADQYSRIIRLRSGADPQGASGAERGGLDMLGVFCEVRVEGAEGYLGGAFNG
jgi:hypothetical protein